MNLNIANIAENRHSEEFLSREAWIANYKRLLLTRLRTIPFDMVRRSYPHITFPFPLTSSQYIIDGVIWALHDNPTYIMESWHATVDHMTLMTERLNDVKERVMSWEVEMEKVTSGTKREKREEKEDKKEEREVKASTNEDKRVKLEEGVQHIKTEENGRTADSEHKEQELELYEKENRNVNQLNFNERQRQELRYNSYAAIQDVYMTFCVIDALLKLTSSFSNNNSSTLFETRTEMEKQNKEFKHVSQENKKKLSLKDKELMHNAHRVMEKELPKLVVEHLPLLTLNENPLFIIEAVEEYRYVFLDLLRSWLLPTSSSSTTIKAFNKQNNTIDNNNKVNKDTQAAECILSNTAQRRLYSYVHRKLKLLQERMESDNLEQDQNNRSKRNTRNEYINQIHDALHALYASTSTSLHVNNINKANLFDIQEQNDNGSIPHSPFTSTDCMSISNPTNSSTIMSSSNTIDKNTIKQEQEGEVHRREVDKKSVKQMIDSFLNSIYPPKGSLAYRSKCTRCGLIFATNKTITTSTEKEREGKTENDNTNTTTRVASANYEGRNAHYKRHGLIKEYLSSKAHVVRLCYPSEEDFIRHVGDYDRSGYFPQLTATLEEASKNTDAMFVQVRKLEKSK